jgi:hypothetical protein
MTHRAAPVSLAGTPLGDTRHACAFFGGDEEEYGTLLPFMKDGLDLGERAIHFVHPEQRDDHRRRLAGAGIDTAAAEERGQLEVRSSTEAYLRDGRFDLERMVAAFEELAAGDGRGGGARSRIVCRMDWAAEGGVVVDDVIEFEARVNHLWQRHDHAVVCSYRQEQVSGDAMVDILRTHPMVIVGGILRRNPFFVPPERFLAELRERRAMQRARPS